jgi:hypothetical protein
VRVYPHRCVGEPADLLLIERGDLVYPRVRRGTYTALLRTDTLQCVYPQVSGGANPIPYRARRL